MPPVPPHRARLPEPAGHFATLPPSDRAFLVELVAAIQREMDLRQRDTTAQRELLLLSPSGSVYALTVSDTGVLGTVLRSQA